MRAKEFITEEISLPNENSLGQPISQSEDALRNFWNWFKGSKVVDKQGRPLVVYHGDRGWKDAIKNDQYRTGKFFTTSPDVAAIFGSHINKVYLNFKNPFIVDAAENNYSQIPTPTKMREWITMETVDTDLIAAFAFKNKYDSAIILNVTEGNGNTETASNYIAFNQTQIKSAIGNTGTYSGNTTIDEDDEQYQGSHTAPDRGQGAPLYDLSLNEFFPDDLYSAQGLRYYGNGSQEDAESYRIAMTYHNKPNALVTIYRSVPDALKGLQKKISTLEKQKAMYMSRGKIPSDAGRLTGTQWYEWACEELEKLEALPTQQQPKYTINDGDWVAVSKRYAVEHGKAHLNNEYSIVSKKVRAKDIFCVGDLSEWGYDPE